MKKRVISVILAATMLLGMTSCTPKSDNASNPPSSINPTSGASDVGETGNAKEVSLEGVEFKIWTPLYWVGKVMSFDDNEAWQEVQKRTGVKLTFEHPPAGQEVEQFNLMIAGDTLPDMICTGWTGDALYVGGGDKYIKDDVILRLNELIDDYAPNYRRTIDEVVLEDQRKDFYTDEGNMFGFYAVSPYEEWCYNGIQYRQDWMDELKLTNPETLDEIENVLIQFKEEKGAKNPLMFPKNGIDGFSGIFMTAWDIGPYFYQKDGKVLYGPTQPEYKEYLKKMNDWYKKGLIDADFATRDEDSMKRMITTGESGAGIHSPDTVGAWMNGITTMMGGAYPVLNKGDKINYRLRTTQLRPPYSFSVTTECKNPEAAVKFLDYGYSEDGYMLYNYGVEGDIYNKTGETFDVNGFKYPVIKYTDKMLNNPDYPVLDAIAKYKAHIGPFLRFEHEGNPTINMSTSTIRKFWTESAGTAYNMPASTLNSEEGKEFARIISQTNVILETATLKFIMGKDSFDNFDKYIEEMKGLEIDRAIELQQAALDRYNNR